MMDEFVGLLPFPMIAAIANEWRKWLSGGIKSMVFVKCVGCWISLGKTGQWMKAEQIAVILGITPVYAGLFRCTAFSRAVGSGGDLIPPL